MCDTKRSKRALLLQPDWKILQIRLQKWDIIDFGVMIADNQ